MAYRNHHYIPIWYQDHFLPRQQTNKELYYLCVQPEIFVKNNGRFDIRDKPWPIGFSKCFSQENLYTLYFEKIESQIIETQFFGQIDHNGSKAVKHFSEFQHPNWDPEAFQNLLPYLCTQKLRTPKGLQWLSNRVDTKDKNKLIHYLVYLRNHYSAIWTECIWQIADASLSNTKFIISDHPVTVYNRRCGYKSHWCKGSNDPDIRRHATHTIFPLSLEKVLILTNLSWIRNPYQSELGIRENPKLDRDAIFDYQNIQTHRLLSESEVMEINLIIKKRAFRYIAAAKAEWLYPENHIQQTSWRNFGEGYLLMPDPRSVGFKTEIIIGNNDGSSTAFDEYGRRPWERNFANREQSSKETNTFYHFIGEFSRLYGKKRRGRSHEYGHLSHEEDNDDMHKYYLSCEEKYKI